MACRSPVYVTNVECKLFASDGDGSVRRYVLTPRRFWGLALGIDSALVGLRVENLSANGGVTMKWEWSLDGHRFKSGSTIITEKASDDDYTGVFNTAAEKTPYGRIVVEIRDTTTTAQVTGDVSSWTQYTYA